MKIRKQKAKSAKAKKTALPAIATKEIHKRQYIPRVKEGPFVADFSPTPQTDIDE